MAAIFSAPGAALATLLHTLGAIGYLGGMGLFIAWRRAIRQGHHNGGTLGTAAALLYVSIAANLLGGFIRTYQPGHPSFSQFFSEPWVAVMVVKHVFLFIGIFAVAYLLELYAPRLRRAWKQGTLDTIRHKTADRMVFAVVLSIVVAAVLGGASTVLLGGASADGGDDALVVPSRPVFAADQHFEGVYTTDAQGGTAQGTFEVPADTARIDASFAVASSGLQPGQLIIAIIDPTGARTQDAITPTGAPDLDLAIERPVAGLWRYEVSGSAVQAQWSLDVSFASAVKLMEGTIRIAAGEAFHLDVVADAGTEMAWDWSSSHDVTWAIERGDEHLFEEDTGRDAGTYTTPAAGTYTYAWHAEREVTLTYAVWGVYE